LTPTLWRTESMLFRDKPLSVIYVEEVLLRPKKILPIEFSDEDSLFKIMGAGSSKERVFRLFA
jgi:hypothetical protein